MQEKIALISDVYANLEALKAVLMDEKIIKKTKTVRNVFENNDWNTIF